MSESPPHHSDHAKSLLAAWHRAVRTHAASSRQDRQQLHRHRRQRSLLNYPGSKSNVVATLLASTPPHATCVEVFAGSAIYSFSKPRSRHEVVNDLDGEIANLFLIIQARPVELAAMMAAAPRSRRSFDALVATDPASLDPLTRAFRTLYIAAHGFCCGCRHKPYFATYRESRPRWGSFELVEAILEWAARFDRVTLECLDFEPLIEKYDSDKTFFLVDSPYPELEYLYRPAFTPTDHVRLARLLRRIRGTALVTLPDRPDVRGLYDWADAIKTLPIKYTMAGKHQKTDELLIYVNHNS